jgi:hypothetical protein
MRLFRRKHTHKWVPVGTYRIPQPYVDPFVYHDPVRNPSFFRNVIVYACKCGQSMESR